MVDLPIKGGCLCGAIRYEISEVPENMGLCYCHSCQRETGSSYLTYMFIPENTFALTGELNWYTTTGGSGKPVHRGSCPKCGALVMGRPEVVPGFCSVMGGSLDDTALFQPKVALWVEDAPAWVTIDPALKQFRRNPE